MAARRATKRVGLLAIKMLVVGSVLAGCSTAISLRSDPTSSTTSTTSTSDPQEHQWLEPEGVAFWNRSDGLLVETVATTACWSGSSTCPGGEIESTSDGGRRWKAMERVRFPLRAAAVTRSGSAWAETGRCSAASADACATRLLLVSTDGGRHWRTVHSDEPVTSISPVSASVAWAVPSDRSGNPSGSDQLAFTRDNGRIWRTRPSPCSRSRGLGTWAVDFPTSRHGWVLCTSEPATDMQAKALYDTTNGGGSWHLEAVSPLLARTGAAQGITAALDLIGTLPGFDMTGGAGGWMWADRGGLLATRNEGRSWTALAAKVVNGDANEVRAGSVLMGGAGFLLIDHPLGADCSKVGCGPELLGTTDGGLHWTMLRSWISGSSRSDVGRC